MNKLSPARVVALIIFLYSASVMAGWLLNIDALLTLVPGQIAMTFITAFSFFLAAIGLWFIESAVKSDNEVPILILPGIAMIILLNMTTILAAGIFKTQTGITDLFIEGNVGNAIVPGFPSVLTIIGFIFFCIAIILSLSESFNLNKNIFHFHGVPLFLIGFTAVIGYIFNLPLLYYKFSLAFNPMALNTALLFILLGVGVAMAERTKQK